MLRYDARGHGASDRATSYPFELHTGDLIGLARALRTDRPVRIGHSMGCAHAASSLRSWAPGHTVTSDAAAEARERWPQLQVLQIEGAGHNVRRDRFEPYWRAVAAFLDAL